MNDFISADHKDQLNNEYKILHLIYHRNYNQHRVLIWWKYFNIIHRNIRKILKLIVDLELEKSSQKIRQKKQQVLDIIKYLMKKKIFTKAYYEFNGIVALGQFVTLGLALIGNTSKLYHILRSFKGADHIFKPTLITEIPVTLTEYSETDDLGEIVEFDKRSEDLQSTRKVEINETKATKKIKKDRNDVEDTFSTKRPKSKLTKNLNSANPIDNIFESLTSEGEKERKKKKKRNEIDDIFNF